MYHKLGAYYKKNDIFTRQSDYYDQITNKRSRSNSPLNVVIK
jgi:hypothetical protein